LESDLRHRQRKKLAAELHDILGQSLQSIKLLLKTGLADMQNGKVHKMKGQQLLLEEIDVAIKQLRQMTNEIHPIFLNSMDLLQAIRSHSNMVYQRIKLPIIIEHDKDIYVLNDMLKEYYYLIYQETLNNIVKHANATRVNIKLSQQQTDWLQMEISDNGQGFDLKSIKHRGHGLNLLQDRTRSMGGTVEIKSTPGQGTCLYIKVPVR